MRPEEALETTPDVDTGSPGAEVARPGTDDASEAAAEPSEAPAAPSEAPAAPAGPIGEPEILEALRNVFDPELGINIVDLGLVYEVHAEDGKIHIVYSLTTMGCPIGPLIEQQMNQYVSQLPGVAEFTAEMVLRPAWSPEMMSDEAKAALGVF
jgi:metal-sulfur cluster biosynthetic enzyme